MDIFLSPYIFSITFGPLIVFGIAVLLIRRFVAKPTTLSGRAAYFSLMLTFYLFAAFTLGLVALVVSSNDAQAAFGLIGIPFFAIPMSAPVFLVGWATSYLFLSARERRKVTILPGGSVAKPKLNKGLIIVAILIIVGAGALLSYNKYTSSLVDKARETTDEQEIRDMLDSYWAERDADIRGAIAYNEVTPSNLLRELSTDEDGDVQYAVASNPNTPQDVLRTLYEERACYYGCGSALAGNRSTPADILRELNKTRGGFTKAILVTNPGTPTDVLIEIYKNEEAIDYVRRDALQALRERGVFDY